jgi:hypothetical protein
MLSFMDDKNQSHISIIREGMDRTGTHTGKHAYAWHIAFMASCSRYHECHELEPRSEGQ